MSHCKLALIRHSKDASEQFVTCKPISMVAGFTGLEVVKVYEVPGHLWGMSPF